MERRESRTGAERDAFTRRTRKYTRNQGASKIKRNARRRERHVVRAVLRNYR